MTAHELECWLSDNSVCTDYEHTPTSDGLKCSACGAWCCCEPVRAAYRSGRADAATDVAEAVSHRRNDSIILPTYPPQSACMCGRVWPHKVDPVAAARGDGERPNG